MGEGLKSSRSILKTVSQKCGILEIKWQPKGSAGQQPAALDHALEGAAEEIARVAELWGLGARIEKAVQEARKRVQEHLAQAGEQHG